MSGAGRSIGECVAAFSGPALVAASGVPLGWDPHMGWKIPIGLLGRMCISHAGSIRFSDDEEGREGQEIRAVPVAPSSQLYGPTQQSASSKPNQSNPNRKSSRIAIGRVSFQALLFFFLAGRFVSRLNS